MSDTCEIVQLRQVDGGVRLLAVTRADARKIERDAAMIECTKPLGVIDVAATGALLKGAAGPAWDDVPRPVRCALIKRIEEMRHGEE